VSRKLLSIPRREEPLLKSLPHLLLLAMSVAFLLQLVAASKHFAEQSMMRTWVLVGGVLVLLTVRQKWLAL
jgi:hypothetical protein